MPGEHARLSPSSAEGPQAVHSRLYRSRGPAKEHNCVGCGNLARDWAYQYSDLDEVETPEGRKYSISMEHYSPMCRRCHIRFDEVKEPRIKESKIEAALAVPAQVRRKAGEMFAKKRRDDPDFRAEMESAHLIACKAGGAATANRLKNDPEFRAKKTAALKEAALVRYRCTSCGYVSNAGTVGRHLKRTNHTGKEKLNAR